MSEETKHWAEKLEVGDKCLATIRHKTDGSKNLHNVEVIIIENAKRLRSVTAWFPEYQVEIPYNELTEIKYGQDYEYKQREADDIVNEFNEW